MYKIGGLLNLFKKNYPDSSRVFKWIYLWFGYSRRNHYWRTISGFFNKSSAYSSFKLCSEGNNLIEITKDTVKKSYQGKNAIEEIVEIVRS